MLPSSYILIKWQRICPIYIHLLSPATLSWSSARVSAHEEGFGRCALESFLPEQEHPWE